MNLLEGSFKNKNLQVGSLSGQNIEIDIKAMDTHGLGLSVPFTDPNALDQMLQKEHSIKYIEATSELDIAYQGYQSYDVATNRKSFYNPKECLFVDSYENAGRTMQLVQNAADLISEMRSSLGSVQNRLEHTIASLDNTAENTSAAESRIRDTNMAQEAVTYSTNQILAQAGQSILAQANQNAHGILSLLQ